MVHKFSLFSVVLIISVFARSVICGAAEKIQTIRLLTVGNSFSQNATRHLADIAKASGRELIHHPAVIGGATMSQHWEKAELLEKDPQDKRGLYSTQRSLKQELMSEPWDVVTIQQASIRSHDVATYRPYARQLHDFIKMHAPRAEVMIHETWAYRSDDPRFAVKSPTAGEPTTQEEMYRGLRLAYATIAAELKLRSIPVGDAFYLVDTDPQWGFRPDKSFDFKTAQRPALPNQMHSLHVGWRWKKQTDDSYALRMDGHHANVAGEYLGGCVFYEMLFEHSPIGNQYVPAGLNREFAKFLQETAHRAVVESKAAESERR